jgi:hypothetical protein
MCLVHELKQFVNYCLQEFPMGLEETRILSYDVHDVRCDNSLVVLAALHLRKAEKVFYNGHKEALLGLLV